ncbi:MAG: TetR/AcrR family transcriptional regulator [Myxacorys chilensis ATA2-1-KO14]|jgi:AcrR family transcriptional regulator|nr:TetR/AcrR family transcriptional regulator [Myxacorys chilensis ATA2-1-KO14]
MEKTRSKREQTRDRLLDAALKVFAQAGITGATTREIARVAGVNEVTLFRHFQSKEQLLEAVVQHVSALQIEALTNQDEWTQNLFIDLKHYAWLFNNTLEAHEDLVRTFIGEARRHPEAARQILQEAAQGLREKLIVYLQQGQGNGTVRADLDLAAAVDSFTGMLLAGMLRRSAASIPLDYSRETYIDQCVDLFVRGVSASSAAFVTPLDVEKS